MRRNFLAFLTGIGIIFFYAEALSACTTILATKRATRDGSVIVSHSDDDELDDQRIIYVPAEEVSYPEWWLKEVRYDKGPISYKRPTEADTKKRRGG